jgi:hypothetical protein
VAGAVLRLLQNGFDIKRFYGGRDLFGLVAYDSNDFFRVQRQAGANYVIYERAAAGVMQNFGEAGFEASAFASGEDENGKIVIGHGQSIVHWTRRFDNAGIIGGEEVSRPRRIGERGRKRRGRVLRW